ncbi:MAG: hypothetical protein KKA81_01645 [Bacteroidetes bacterium]|nr:hypothetical protein [Bacteroidota bacterium]
MKINNLLILACMVSSSFLPYPQTCLAVTNGVSLTDQKTENERNKAANILFEGIENTLTGKNTLSSRSFLSLVTRTGPEQIAEVYEAFYQARLTGAGEIEALDLKNGRFIATERDIIPAGSGPAVSLLKNIRIMGKHTGEDYPVSPLSLNKAAFRKKTECNIVNKFYEEGKTYSVITFHPINVTDAFFSGEAVVDASSRFVKYLTLNYKPRTSKHAVQAGKRTEYPQCLEIQYTIHYRFGEEGESIPETIKLDYTFEMNIAGEIKHFHSSAALLFYDYTEPFLMPLCKPDDFAYDEDKIMILPVDDNGFDLIPEENKLKVKPEVTEKTIIFGYSGVNNCEANPWIYWKPERDITWADFDAYAGNDKNGAKVIRDRSSGKVSGKGYDLCFRIIANCEYSNDSINVSCHTVFNRNKSYFHNERTPEALEFINLQFDLVESFRMRMHQTICKRGNILKDAGKLKKTYQDYISRMNEMLDQMASEVELGQNTEIMDVWRERVELEMNRLAIK